MFQNMVNPVGGSGGSVKLLWENSNPNTGFQAQTLNLGQYDNYIIESKFSTPSTGQIPSAVDTKNSSNKAYAYQPATGGTGTSQITYRDLTISGGSITFSIGKLANSSASDTNYCVPQRIWGYNN